MDVPFLFRRLFFQAVTLPVHQVVKMTLYSLKIRIPQTLYFSTEGGSGAGVIPKGMFHVGIQEGHMKNYIDFQGFRQLDLECYWVDLLSNL